MKRDSEISSALNTSLRDHLRVGQRVLLTPLGWIGILLVVVPLWRIGGLQMAPVALAAVLLSLVAVTYYAVTQQRTQSEKVREMRELMLVKMSGFVDNLTGPARARFNQLHSQVGRLADLFPDSGKAAVKPGEHLLWLYLKLLTALNHLLELDRSSPVEEIAAALENAEAQYQKGSQSESARESRRETVDLLTQRLLVARQRALRIEEVECDLTRIEHKVALLHDRAAQQSTLGEAGFRIDLINESLNVQSMPSIDGGTVEELDEFFAGATAH